MLQVSKPELGSVHKHAVLVAANWKAPWVAARLQAAAAQASPMFKRSLLAAIDELNLTVIFWGY